MEAQKKRTVNFSSDEKKILAELVLKYQDIVENKRTDATTNSTKMRGWMRLAEEYNTISTYCHRTHTVLKCCWENIKRQTKKDRADKKKKIFMTGGGNPPSPPPSNGVAGNIVDAILGPALEGIPNIYDSDANTEINEILMEVTLEENADAAISKENNKNINNKEENPPQSHSGILNENNDGDDTWSSWTPKNLKTPLTNQLRVPRTEEDWLRRRRPKTESLTDTLIKEKINLVKILKENAEKESLIRLAILEEQLKQEKIKTKAMEDKN